MKTFDLHILHIWRPPVAGRGACAFHKHPAHHAGFARPGVVIAYTALMAALLLLAMTGQAFGAHDDPVAIPASLAAGTPLSGSGKTAGDAQTCLPLLKIASRESGNAAPPRAALPSPETGAAVALGVILGMQQVIGPRETGLQKQVQSLPRRARDVATAGHDNGQAIAIAAYRRCVNQKTLEARNTVLHDWRWTR